MSCTPLYFAAPLALALLAGCDQAGSADRAGGSAPPAASETTTPVQPETDVASLQTDTCTGAGASTEVFAGFWRTQSGAARFGAHTTSAGATDLTLRNSNGGLTMTIDGFPTVRLQRLARGAAAWTWSTSADVSVTPEDAVITAGCADQDGFARFTGSARVQAEGGGSAMTIFRLMMYTPDEGLLHWEIGPPMQSSGLFAVSRAR
ncbi:MAG: hypothetical protein J0L52_05450 [Caulobacterales bacterium]|nr:hypothetical protein [Caulobacterales bacterium]